MAEDNQADLPIAKIDLDTLVADLHARLDSVPEDAILAQMQTEIETLGGSIERLHRSATVVPAANVAVLTQTLAELASALSRALASRRAAIAPPPPPEEPADQDDATFARRQAMREHIAQTSTGGDRDGLFAQNRADTVADTQDLGDDESGSLFDVMDGRSRAGKGKPLA